MLTLSGGLRLTLPVADFTEIRMRIMQYGHNVEVLAPPELRRQVAEEVAATMEMYEEKEKNEINLGGGSLYDPGGVLGGWYEHR